MASYTSLYIQIPARIGPNDHFYSPKVCYNKINCKFILRHFVSKYQSV